MNRILLSLVLVMLLGMQLPALTLKQAEDSLKKIGPRCFKGSDQEKALACEQFGNLLHQALELDGAFNYPFDSLKFIARLTAPDNAFRIFNWNLPYADGTHKYFGFILVDEQKVRAKLPPNAKRFVLYTLTDKSAEIRNPELSELSPEKWYGALYYKIILTTHKKKKYYTLLGWDGNNNQSWKKLIDVITFNKSGKLIFGEELLFHRDRRSSRRVIFEFKAEVIMALKYEDDKKRIVFDRLAPEVSGAEGMYQFYTQTFEYDSYVFKKGKWQFVADADAKNNKDRKDKLYRDPNNQGAPKNDGLKKQ